ncbi:MAG: UDP-N-acetylmuramoyl-L-alanyl-D-glutamate--2,6-diaminopimelate ligase [Deltaproteobacteria bacterium]|jgi:UDP-N-acetylmuramoyl-L-alanyl-D-glutamate--2,6-diaminopimelate ligase|nr:UDP-N-acetylmuramoyl-L-alanyl-D-glutamate--2,6-diaminopimelate ligase [Deltaproteobacteria bacterium]
MRLSELCSSLGLRAQGPGDPQLAGLTEDSREVNPGFVFAAVKGQRSDGRSFVGAALEAGAVAVLAPGDGEALGDLPVPVLLAPAEGFREKVSQAARLVYGKPDESLVTIGVTGTNGKTTTTYLLEDILNRHGLGCGVIGTVNYRWPVRPEGAAAPRTKVIEAPNTTPEGPLLWGTLARMLADGAKAVVIEVSSHALELGRLGDLRFDLAIFTNLSRDHLDFHGDMESYYLAKRRLFTERLKDGAKKSVIGADDPYGRRLLGELGERAVGFGLSVATDYFGRDLELTRGGIKLTLERFARPMAHSLANGQASEGLALVRSPLLGTFNAINVLGALAAAGSLGLDQAKALASLAKSRGAPGRLERVGINDDYLVLVDYSHTPGAVAAALESLRELKPNRLVCVFGCGGDRDKGKRPMMAETAGALADIAVLTSDNPRTENPMDIMADAEVGFRKLGLSRALGHEGVGRANHTYLAEPDRALAIKAACALMVEGDILLIAGKGHETYQIIGTAKRPFDDCQVALAALEETGKA